MFSRLMPLVLLLVLCPIASAVAQPRALVDRPDFEFGEILRDTPVQHDYRIRNIGSSALHIRQVALTPPLRVIRMPAQMTPGEEASIAVGMDPNGMEGPFDGRIVLFFDDSASAETELKWSGRIVPPIEIDPAPAFYLAGQRGAGAEAALTIVNHTPEPLRLGKPLHSTAHFTSRLEAIDEGKRYRLTIALLPDGPGGKHSDEILIRTSSDTLPLVKIPANTYLRERVYTFPDAVDLGGLRLADIKARPGLLAQNAQTLMVYRKGGVDFRIRVTSDVPELAIEMERSAEGDRYQLTVSLSAQRDLHAGPIRGSIAIETNDPEFPHLRVPVSGDIIGG